MQAPITVRRIGANTAAMWVHALVSAVGGILFMRLLLGELGRAQAGLWQTAQDVLSSVIALDLGIGLGVTRLVSRGLITGGRGRVYCLINTAAAVTVALSGVLVAVMLVLALVMPRSGAVGAEAAGPLFQTLLILALAVPAVMMRTAFQATLMGLQQRYKLILTLLLGQLVFWAAAAMMLLAGIHDLRLLAAVLAASHVLSLVMMALLTRAGLGYIPLGRRWVRRELVRPLLRFGLEAFLLPLSLMICYQLDSVLITTLRGEQFVPPYRWPMQLIMQVRGIAMSLGVSLMPVAAQLHERRQHDPLRELYCSASRMTATLASCMLVPLAVFGEAFMQVWLPRENMGWTWQLLAILALGQLPALAVFPAERMLIGAGRIAVAARAELLAAGAKVAAALLVLSLLAEPLTALAWATTLPVLIVSIFIVPASICRQNNMPLGAYLRTTLGRQLLAAAPAVIMLLGIRAIWRPASLLESLAQLAVGAVVCGAFGLLLALTASDRRRFGQLLARP
jgi:O-antigen/teichoic acid export membrane protein